MKKETPQQLADRLKRDDLTGGDYDVAVMFKNIKTKKGKNKLAINLLERYWHKMTSFQKSKCFEHISFWQRWRLQNIHYDRN